MIKVKNNRMLKKWDVNNLCGWANDTKVACKWF